MPSKSKGKRQKTPLARQLFSALQIYAVFLNKATPQEKAALERRLRETNLEFSIYDAINIKHDLEMLL